MSLFFLYLFCSSLFLLLQLQFPCFPKLILTKFVRSVRASIFSIISNHPTDLLLQNADNLIAILCKYANCYAATLLTLHSSMCVFFFLLGFLSQTFTIPMAAGKDEGYLLNFSLLLPPVSEIRNGNPWFPSACVSFHLCVIIVIRNRSVSYDYDVIETVTNS